MEKWRIKSLSLFFGGLVLTSCSLDLPYLWDVSRGQFNLINNRVSIKKALEKYEFTAEEKKKLQLVSEIKTFAREKLEMDIDQNIYSTYVQLDQPYVTYLLRVSKAYELKAYQWSFPVIGLAPYKGFFDKEKAKEEAKSFPKEEYDVYIRGVSAYSTLGWFEDSILSSMLSYDENDFVLMIFHELIHTVLFFKDHINFNERFAEFLGRKATISFYLDKEGRDSERVKKMIQQWEDELVFSSFMVKEYEDLNLWYKKNKGSINPKAKQQRIRDIQNRFLTDIQPQLQTKRYDYFPNITLNNAMLLSYQTYNFNMKEFEKLFNSSLINKNIKTFIEYCSEFEYEDDPEQALSEAILILTIQQ